MAHEKRSAVLRRRRPSGTRQARARARLAVAATLIATAALGVAGCAAATAGPATGTTTAGSAATAGVATLTQAQARQVFDAYVAASTKAARTNDGKLALSVVTAAQQSLVSASLTSHSVSIPASGGSSAYSSTLSLTPAFGDYTYGQPTFYLPEPAGYPRFFLTGVTRALTFRGLSTGNGATTSVGGATVPLDGRVLMVFEQSGSGGPWQLGSVAQLPAGSAIPRLAADSNGYVPQVPLTSAGLLAKPYSAGPLQAAVVDDGPGSAAAAAVAAGSLTTGLYQAARDRSDSGLAVPSGDVYQWSMEGTPYPAFALRTADGGALVLYAMYLNSTVAVPGYLNDADPIQPGDPIKIPPGLRPLLPSGQAAPRVQLTAQSLFSFAAVDPPAAARSKLTVIAIGGALNYASAT